MNKKNCMFQYAIAYRYITTEIVENTDLITLEEAKELWRKHLPSFIAYMNNREGGYPRPEMVIWVDCPDNTTYVKEYAHIDENNEVEGDSVYNVTKTKVEI